MYLCSIHDNVDLFHALPYKTQNTLSHFFAGFEGAVGMNVVRVNKGYSYIPEGTFLPRKKERSS